MKTVPFSIIIVLIIMLSSCGSASTRCVEQGGFPSKIDTCVCDAYSAIGRCLSYGGTSKVTLSNHETGQLSISGQNSSLIIGDMSYPITRERIEAGLHIYSDEIGLNLLIPRSTRFDKTFINIGECIVSFDQEDDLYSKKDDFTERRLIKSSMECPGGRRTSYDLDGFLAVSNVQVYKK